MLPVLHIRLLGEFGLASDDGPITSVDTARAQALLAYLVLHAEAPQQRQYLAFRFWPDSTEKQARTNLRQLLHNLRRALPHADDVIAAGTRTLQWRHDAGYTLDVAGFEQALARVDQADQEAAPQALRQTLEDAVRLYTGDLLPGCYDEWIEPVRERLRQKYIAALDRLVRLLEEQRAYKQAIPYAGQLLLEEPLRETTYRALMRLHALLGDRASALRVYHRCAAVLEEELGVEPDPATSHLHERLLNMQAPAEESKRLRTSTAVLPLVGRQPEWSRLQEAWSTAMSERPQVALIAGEAGVGKTRLAEELLTWVERQGRTTARTRCYAAEGRLAFAPISDWLRAGRLRAGISKLESVWKIELSRLLPELSEETPDAEPPEPLTESWQRRRLFEAMARAVLSAPPPVVLLIDDLQWCDPDSLEWLHYLLRFDRNANLLLLGTVRIEEVGPADPLEMLLLDLRRAGQVTEILLGPLNAEDTARLATNVAGRALDQNQTAQLYRETEGNPLFVVEGVRAGQLAPDAPAATMYGAGARASAGSPSNGGGALTANVGAPTGGIDALPHGVDALPPKVHAVLAARLAQCSPAARRLAHLAAVVGRAFTYGILFEASDRHEDALIQSLDELWQRRIVREYGDGTYDFSHDKLREVAYAEATPARRRQLHRAVAEALETVHAAAPDPVSGQLAAHYERAGMPERALPNFMRAARVAQQVYANEEAIAYLNRALALLEQRPPGPERDAFELSLLVLLGSSVAAARGFSATETGRVYARARTLCSPEADLRLLFSVYWGSYSFNLVRAELQNAYAFSEQCLLVAQEAKDPALLAAAHFALGVSMNHLGKLASAREHLEQTFALCAPAQHRDYRTSQIGIDPGVFSLAYLAHTLWLLGFPDQALAHGREALALSVELNHPFSQVIALSYLAMLHQFRRERDAVSAYAESAVDLSVEHGFPYYEAWGTIMKGWAVHQDGASEEGLAHMSQGLRDFHAIGTGLREPYYTALMAEAHHSAGRVDKGMMLLTEAITGAEKSEERWHVAELQRLRGEMLLMEGNAEKAEACFCSALDAARHRQARSLELRAAMSLSRLWQRRGCAGDARKLLEPVLGAFTEGFDAPDLQDAQILLNELR